MNVTAFGSALSSPLVTGVTWLRAALLGSVGTVATIVAVGTVGLLMLQGRLPFRRGATVVLGCFIIFSAGTIADALVSTLGRPLEPVLSPIQRSYAPIVAQPDPYDPYAGASVPNQQAEQPILK